MIRKGKNASKGWYVLPIFFGILGSIISFMILRRENWQLAKDSAIIGIFWGPVHTMAILVIIEVYTTSRLVF